MALRQPWMDFYIVAHDELGSERTINGLIPWSAIRRYAEHYGFGGGEFEWFKRVIWAIDGHLRDKRDELEAQQRRLAEQMKGKGA
jgi:hypothetical protein